MVHLTAEPRERVDPQVVMLLGLCLLVFLTVGLMVPLTTTTIVDRLAEPKRFVGYAIGALTAGAFLGRMVAGAIVDGIGARRGFLVACSIVAVSGVLSTVPVTVASFIVARFVHGLGEAMLYTCAATTVLNRVPIKRRSRYLGLLGSAVWGGMSLGPALVDWSSWLNRPRGAGLVTMLVGLTGLVVAPTLITPKRLDVALPEGTPRRRMSVSFPKSALLPSVTVGCYNLAYAAVTGFVILHLRAEGLDTRYALSFYGVAVLCGRLLFGGIPDRLGPRPSLMAGLTLMFGALSIVAWAPSLWAVRIGLAVFGIGYSMPFPALASIAVDRTPERQRASAIAMLGFVYDAFVFVGGLTFGFLADAELLKWVLPCGLAGIAVAGILAMRVTSTTQDPTRVVEFEPA